MKKLRPLPNIIDPAMANFVIQLLMLVALIGFAAPVFGESGWHKSTATYYNPAGGFGACGTKLQDSDMIVALGVQDLGSHAFPYPKCGRCIQVRCVGSTNSVPACKNKNAITVRVADRCEACASDGHLDLSEGAFKRIANTDAGRVKIEYKYVGCKKADVET